MAEPDRIMQLVLRCDQLERENADLRRYVEELRAAISVLMQPAPSEVLEKNRAHPSRQTLQTGLK